MILNTAITRCRAFLRDPDGDIWSDEDIREYFHDAQNELAQKTHILVRAESHYYPQPYNWAFMFDHEESFVEGDRWRVLRLLQTTGWVCCAPWENGYWLDTLTGYDDGGQITQPWESYYTAYCDPLPIELHDKFHRVKFIAFDRKELLPLTQREISSDDRYFRTREGEVTNYYRPDDEGNKFYLYPKPGTIVFQDTEHTDVLDDTGGLVSSSEAYRDSVDLGVTTDIIIPDDALFVVYECLPEEREEWDDDLTWPDWQIKYVIYGTLERCFGADTDGFIPTLRDYWRARKEAGFEALKRYSRMRMGDRDFRLGGFMQKTRSRHGGSLPAGYPAI